LLACWDCGFEFLRGHGFLSLERAVCCQVENSESADHSSRGVLLRVACIAERDREASVMRWSWPARGFRDKEGGGEAFSLNLVRVNLILLLIIESLIISKALNTVNVTKQQSNWHGFLCCVIRYYEKINMGKRCRQ